MATSTSNLDASTQMKRADFSVPFIPDNAPFTEEQRAWLNGFLAGLYSHAQPAAPVNPPPSLKIAVLYGSQSGNGESLARKVMRELTSKGHVASLHSLEAYTSASLAEERYAVFIVSTYGEGDPPDAVQPFYNQICIEHFPRFENLSYALLALGDSNYEHFCKFGRDLDEKLASLGAFRLCERIDCDVDLDDAFATWKQSLFRGISEVLSKPSDRRTAIGVRVSSEPRETDAKLAAKPTRENPYMATLVDRRNLTDDKSSKLTLHMAISIAGSGISYEAGDACGVIPQNDPRLADEILHKLKFSPPTPLLKCPKLARSRFVQLSSITCR